MCDDSGLECIEQFELSPILFGPVLVRPGNSVAVLKVLLDLVPSLAIKDHSFICETYHLAAIYKDI